MKYEIKNIDKALLIEFENITLPEPIFENWFMDQAYAIPEFTQYGKRWRANLKNQSEVNLFFTKLVNNIVFPKMFENNPKQMEYPFTSEFLIKNSTTSVSFCKDEPGWLQPTHIDNRSYILTGIFHLIDSPENGTSIHGSDINGPVLYNTPSLKNTGAFWLNDIHSFHSLQRVNDYGRLIYMVHVRWDFNY